MTYLSACKAHAIVRSWTLPDVALMAVDMLKMLFCHSAPRNFSRIRAWPTIHRRWNATNERHDHAAGARVRVRAAAPALALPSASPADIPIIVGQAVHQPDGEVTAAVAAALLPVNEDKTAPPSDSCSADSHTPPAAHCIGSDGGSSAGTEAQTNEGSDGAACSCFRAAGGPQQLTTARDQSC